MNKDCKTILPLISELMDGALDPDTEWKVRMHLSICPECAEASREMAGTTELIQALPKRPLSEGFDSALAARIAALPSRKSRAFGVFGLVSPLGGRWRMAVAALAAAVLLGALIVRLPLHALSPKANPNVAAPSDSVLLATCLAQHHSYAASDPLADPSAQSLASQVDSPNTGGTPPAVPISTPENM